MEIPVNMVVGMSLLAYANALLGDIPEEDAKDYQDVVGDGFQGVVEQFRQQMLKDFDAMEEEGVSNQEFVKFVLRLAKHTMEGHIFKQQGGLLN